MSVKEDCFEISRKSRVTESPKDQFKLNIKKADHTSRITRTIHPIWHKDQLVLQEVTLHEDSLGSALFCSMNLKGIVSGETVHPIQLPNLPNRFPIQEGMKVHVSSSGVSSLFLDSNLFCEPIVAHTPYKQSVVTESEWSFLSLESIFLSEIRLNPHFVQTSYHF